ncbi:MAG: flagellar basal body rod protein FlgC [Sulfobacillus sp.]
MFDAMKISASGLTAESLRLDVISNNLANIDTTQTPQGGPYRREFVVFSPVPATLSGADANIGQGVVVSAILQDPSPFKAVYDPTSPLANAQGEVLYPNVNLATEMVDMIEASQAYQANSSAFTASKDMVLKALSIGS